MLDCLQSHGSCHPLKTAVFRRHDGLLRFPVDPSIPTRVTRPLCSMGITPLHRYYGAVRPCPTHRYFRPRGFSACALYGLPSSGFQNDLFFLLSSSVSLFDLELPFLRPDPAVLQSRRAQGLSRLAGAPTFPRTLALARPCLDSSEHGGTLDTVGMTIRGEPAFGRADQSRHNLVFGESKDPNHDAAMRIGSEAPRRRTPFFSSAQKP